MDEVELLIINYFGYSPKSNVERLKAIGAIINYFDKEISENFNNIAYVDYMLGRKVEALQMSIELSLYIIINRHCEYKL